MQQCAGTLTLPTAKANDLTPGLVPSRLTNLEDCTVFGVEPTTRAYSQANILSRAGARLPEMAAAVGGQSNEMPKRRFLNRNRRFVLG